MLRTWVVAIVLVGGTARADKLDVEVTKAMQVDHTPGLSLAVVKNGKVIKLGAYGVANLEHRVKVTPATRFEIASMSKMFIATAIRQLADDGKLDLEDPVSKYLDRIPAAWKAMRVRHLVAMSAGLPEDWNLLCWCDVRDEYDDTSMLAAFAKLALLSPIGERYHYSSPAYAMLGMIVTKVTGKPFADVVAARSFATAGMTETTFNDPTAVLANRADGYRFDAPSKSLKRGFYVAPYMHARADVGILTTPRDLAKWVVALDAGKIVRDPARLTTAFTSDDGKHDLRYGYGWVTALVAGHLAVLHDGAFRTGFRSLLMRFPDEQLTIILATNCARCGDTAMTTVVRHYLGVSAAPTKDGDPAGTTKLIAGLQGAAKKIDPAMFADDALATIADMLGGLSTATITFHASHSLRGKAVRWHNVELADYISLRIKLGDDDVGLDVYRDAAGVVRTVEPTP